MRILVIFVALAVVTGVTLWWRARDGHLHEASGSVRPEDLGLSRPPRESATIVQFTGAGCGPCVPLRKRLDALAEEIGDVRVVSIDAGERLDLADRYGVKRIPTVVITDQRLRIRWRASGAPVDAEIRAALLGPDWTGRPHPDPAPQPR